MVPGTVSDQVYWDYHHAVSGLHQRLRQWLRQGSVPPVILLTGQAGVGKREVAYQLARWILCQQAGGLASGGGSGVVLEQSASSQASLPQIDSCGVCQACARIPGEFAAGQQGSQDVNLVLVRAQIEEGEAGSGDCGMLKIDELREMQKSAGFAPYQSHAKVILLEEAQQMTVSAAQSLLKILEEPPAGWVFLLTAADPALLLATVVSRCHQLRLRCFSAEALESVLTTQGPADLRPEERQGIVLSSQGSLKRAWAGLDGKSRLQRQQVRAFWQDPGAHFAAVLEWASLDAASLSFLLDECEVFLWQLTLTLTPALVGSSAQQQRAGGSGGEGGSGVGLGGAWLERLQSAGGWESFRDQQWEGVQRARKKLASPVNRKLLAQEVLMVWWEFFTR